MVPFSTAGLATGQDTVLCSTFCFLSAPPRSGAAVGWISEWMGAHHPADCAGRLVVLLEHPQDLLLPQRGEARLVLPVEEQSDQAVPLHKVHRRRRVTRLETDHGGLDLKGQVLRAGQGALPADGCALPAEETCVCLSPRPQQERPPQSPQHLPNAAAPLQRRLPSAVGESSRGRPSSGGRFSQAAGCSHPACTAAAAAAAASVTVDAPWSRLSRAASHFLAAPPSDHTMLAVAAKAAVWRRGGGSSMAGQQHGGGAAGGGQTCSTCSSPA